MASFLDFEKPIAELQGRIDELRDTAADGALDIDAEVAKIQVKSDRLLRDTYARLTPWQKTQVARHPERPHFNHYVSRLIEDFMPLGGDRAFAEAQRFDLGPLQRDARFEHLFDGKVEPRAPVLGDDFLLVEFGGGLGTSHFGT